MWARYFVIDIMYCFSSNYIHPKRELVFEMCYLQKHLVEMIYLQDVSIFIHCLPNANMMYLLVDNHFPVFLIRNIIIMPFIDMNIEYYAINRLCYNILSIQQCSHFICLQFCICYAEM